MLMTQIGCLSPSLLPATGIMIQAWRDRELWYGGRPCMTFGQRYVYFFNRRYIITVGNRLTALISFPTKTPIDFSNR